MGMAIIQVNYSKQFFHLAEMNAFLCMCVCLYLMPAESRTTYEGHLVLRISPKSDEEVHEVRRLLSSEESKGIFTKFDNTKYIFVKQYDVWRNSPFDVRLSPEQYAKLQPMLTELDVDSEVIISDVQTTAEDQRRRLSSCSDCFDYSSYHTLEEINQWIFNTAWTYYDIAEVIAVSKSYENRTIWGIKISTNNSSSDRSGVWLEAGIHAREWIAPATVLYMTSKLLEDYENGHASTVTVVDAFEWYIVPVLNVDGYVYTWTDDRMWRKTRSHNLNEEDCVGVDPNRNWDCHWGGAEEGQTSGGSSGNPCMETYRGPQAFSEPCVKGVADYLLHLRSEVSFKVFLDFHSYSQMWMSPWGYTENETMDFNIQDAASVAAVSAIAEVSGTEYDHGPIASTIYPANGNSVDWAYADLGATYSAAVELRDKGDYGFLLPPEQIVPCGEETYTGVMKYVEYVMENI